jgi:S-adenosylmethionine:tRNA ribosyltransferase-isomerase
MASMLRTMELDYDLPESAIATTPAEPRDSARLMVVRRSDPSYLEHLRVRDLPHLLDAGDLMIVNATKVIQARFEGIRADTGGGVEGLYLGPGPTINNARTWGVLLQGKRMKEGICVTIFDATDAPSRYKLRLLSKDPREAGGWIVGIEHDNNTPLREGDTHDAQILEVIGRTPLPPYIVRARKHTGQDESQTYDKDRYQTVYAHETPHETAHATQNTKPIDPHQSLQTAEGSVAAPTAGLHFTPDLLARLASQNITREEVTLHVGLGTFKSVESEFVEQHNMHSERCFMPASVRNRIIATRAANHRVLCVGTTAARTVESYARLPTHPADWLDTSILITPGYQWQWTTCMLTNFHLPKSTLMAMIASLLGNTPSELGVDRLKRYYRTALEHNYRFYSYGDAMCILA